MFIKGEDNWINFRNWPGLLEVNLHFGRGDSGQFWNNMAEVASIVKRALQGGQECGLQFVMVLHGGSTSGPFKTSARSVVREIMRGKESTPFIIKARSVQHHSVFVAAVRPKGMTAIQFIVKSNSGKELTLWRTSVGYIGRKAYVEGLPPVTQNRKTNFLENEEEVFDFFGKGRLAMELYEKAGLKLR